jgi:nitrate reductase NapE component
MTMKESRFRFWLEWRDISVSAGNICGRSCVQSRRRNLTLEPAVRDHADLQGAQLSDLHCGSIADASCEGVWNRDYERCQATRRRLSWESQDGKPCDSSLLLPARECRARNCENGYREMSGCSNTNTMADSTQMIKSRVMNRYFFFNISITIFPILFLAFCFVFSFIHISMQMVSLVLLSSLTFSQFPGNLKFMKPLSQLLPLLFTVMISYGITDIRSNFGLFFFSSFRLIVGFSVCFSHDKIHLG